MTDEGDQKNMGSITLGTKLFTRTAKTHQLLTSVPDAVDRVIIADDGDEDLSLLIREDWPFTLEIIDLPYDSGLGAGRQAIVDAVDSEYLLIVDTDHEVPDNVGALRDILEADPSIGGVSGMIDNGDGPTGLFHDLVERDGMLLRTFDHEPPAESIAGHRFREFDFVPNAALFRTDALAEYAWDPAYTIGREHLDFYVGHMDTDWRFGVAPDVVFPHHPGGSAFYERNRASATKLAESKRYFREKWGYDAVVYESDWKGKGSGDNPLHPLPYPDFMPLSAAITLKKVREAATLTLRG